MEPNKLEKHIKKQLDNREIQPSAGAWDRLDAMLTVTEEKKTKKVFFSYWSIGIAAAVLVCLFAALFFFTQNNEVTPNSSQPDVVHVATQPTDTVTTVTSTSKGTTVSLQPVQQIATVSNETSNRSKERVMPQKQKVSIINPTISSPNLSENKANNQVAQLQQPQVVSPENSQQVVKPELKTNNTPVAQGPQTNSRRIKVDASALLKTVDGEVEQTFRDRVLDRVSKNYKEVKVALSNRNYQQ